jgi:hypothetical protein
MQGLTDVQAAGLDVSVERHPFDEFHREIVNAAIHASLIHPGDVWMFQPRGELDLALESLAGALGL